jgi:hypothetical protein
MLRDDVIGVGCLNLFQSFLRDHSPSDLKPDSLGSSEPSQVALSTWDNEGGAGPYGPQQAATSGEGLSELRSRADVATHDVTR